MRLPAAFHRQAYAAYWQTPLGERDLFLAELLERSVTAARGTLEISEDEDGPTLRFLAERLATLAVRKQRPDLLSTALRALVLGSTDEREAALVFPLVVRAGEILGVAKDRLVMDAIDGTAGPLANDLAGLADRQFPPIEDMGYKETGAGADFQYKRVW